MMKAAVPVWPGAMLPKSAVNVGEAGWPSTVVPRMLKPTRSPCAFSTILGWAVVMVKLSAGP